ncbi:unnamed protein product [Amoebophrya sp. A25]|nr:unnamed protein product [Amoebophrya sp. A25]|eukprot:GSA25T00009508001.1
MWSFVIDGSVLEFVLLWSCGLLLLCMLCLLISLLDNDKDSYCIDN